MHGRSATATTAAYPHVPGASRASRNGTRWFRFTEHCAGTPMKQEGLLSSGVRPAL